MSDYYEAIGKIQKLSPMPSDGQIIIPPAVSDAVPLRLRNLPPDEIAFAGANTVMRDSATNALMIDSYDLAQALPTSEWALRSNPAVMRVIASLGGQAVDGFLVDYRHIALHSHRYSGLEEGTDSAQFQSLRESCATIFPLGVLLNDAGKVHYIGHPELQDHATNMMQRVDAFVAERWPAMFKHAYLIPAASDAIVRPARPHLDTIISSSPTSEKAFDSSSTSANRSEQTTDQEAD